MANNTNTPAAVPETATPAANPARRMPAVEFQTYEGIGVVKTLKRTPTGSIVAVVYTGTNRDGEKQYDSAFVPFATLKTALSALLASAGLKSDTEIPQTAEQVSVAGSDHAGVIVRLRYEGTDLAIDPVGMVLDHPVMDWSKTVPLADIKRKSGQTTGGRVAIRQSSMVLDG